MNAKQLKAFWNLWKKETGGNGEPRLPRPSLLRHKPIINTVGILHNHGAFGLAKNFGELYHRQSFAGDNIAQNVTSPNRGQLVNIAHKNHLRFRRHSQKHK